MPRLFVLVVLLLGQPLAASSAEQLEQPQRTTVFTSGTEGYRIFRIPALVVSGRGTVLAFCEGRKNGGSDSGDIDVVLKRSIDHGRTWQPLQVVADDGPHTMGNPCPVLDCKTGVVWLLLTRNHGQDRQQEIESGTSLQPRTVWITSSADHGTT